MIYGITTGIQRKRKSNGRYHSLINMTGFDLRP